MMRFPCSACGGRGPHLGEGHAYTTDPKFMERETDRRVRIVDIIGQDPGVSDMGRLAVAMATASIPDRPPEFWAERDGWSPLVGFEQSLDDIVARAREQLAHWRAGRLTLPAATSSLLERIADVLSR